MDTDYKPLILLADDDPDYLFQTKFALERAGFNVVAVESMEEAEVVIDKGHPKLAIFDLMMERDDAGFILSYHAKRKHPSMPVILLTAVTAETGRQFGSGMPGAGEWIKADLYLEKGLHPDQLIEHVKSLLIR
ncbi:MAG: response regulator [Bacteroidales bacterium]|jgi:DNA-binding response OmpR family regulator